VDRKFVESEEFFFYEEKFRKYGIDPKSLGWQKVSQEKRFEKICEIVELRDKSLLDIGAGFLDLATYISGKKIALKSYTALEPMPDFYNLGTTISKQIKSFKSEIFFDSWESFESNQKFDIVVAVGVLNLVKVDNYQNLEGFISKFLKFTNEYLIISLLKTNRIIEHNNLDESVFFYDPDMVSNLCVRNSLRYSMITNYLPHDLILKIEV
jgi:cyclopropane fatty-acyl-phospholipid synthase-like methyltransferase